MMGVMTRSPRRKALAVVFGLLLLAGVAALVAF